MTYKPAVYKHASTIAERDGGWFCNYCRIRLVPAGYRVGDPEYYIGVAPAPERIFDLKPGFANYEVDHRVPPTRGGNHKLENLVLSCVKCNQRKNRKTDVEFIEWRRVKGFAP